MKDAGAKLDRANAILRLIEKLAKKLPSSMSQEARNGEAMAELDKEVGDGWKEEVKRAGLEMPEHEEAEGVMHERKETECMYDKIKKLLEAEGEHTEAIIPRLNGEEDEEEEKGAHKLVRILIGK